MSEPPIPDDPNERDFSKLLQPGIRELREQRGPCPSSEELVAFHENRLPAQAAARVRDHVEACGLCDVQLGRLDAADRPRKRSAWQALRAIMWRPAVAYGLAVLLLFPAYRGLVRRPAGPGFGVAPVPSFSLDVARSGSQGQRSPSFVALAGGEKFFLLAFFIPLKPSPPHRYDVVVVRQNQSAVVPPQTLRDCDPLGNCSLLCDAAIFAPGWYEARVHEVPSRVVYAFPFQVTRRKP